MMPSGRADEQLPAGGMMDETDQEDMGDSVDAPADLASLESVSGLFVCVRACVRACVCVRVCVRARARVCVCFHT